MSIRVMAVVWSNVPYEGGAALLVRLATADWAVYSGYLLHRSTAKNGRMSKAITEDASKVMNGVKTLWTT